ncbi:MAG: ice-binding family protein [Archangium sp.]|nr:ice-binding family protein [Archangium sp.]
MSPRPLVVSLAAILCLAGCNGADSSPVGRTEQGLSSGLPTLGSAADYAVLANAAITCTDGSISGSVGTLQSPPEGSVTQTNCPIAGSIDIGNAASTAAYADFLRAYDAVADQPCDEFLTGTLDGVTLTPGTYCFSAAAELTGTLTLDGPSTATWIFKIGTSGTGALTGTNFNVVMAGGGDPCNVTWWIAEAATLTDSNFLGTILAGAADTVTRGTFDGRTFAKADVTITGAAMTACIGGSIGGNPKPNPKAHCNQGVGNGAEGCDPGNSNNHNPTNDESGGTPGKPGRKP